MSTDWNIHCVDCKETHYFEDANHQDGLMLAICRHADEIASLAALLDDGAIELRTLWGRVDARWFAKHMGHNLMPISEYGDLLDQCGEYIDCVCGSRRRCTKKLEHDGAHEVLEHRRR